MKVKVSVIKNRLKYEAVERYFKKKGLIKDT